MTEDSYGSRNTRASASIASTWPTPSSDPPPVAVWLAAQYAEVFVRQTTHADDGRIALTDAWAALRDGLLGEARRVVERRSEDEWARASAGHGERVEAAERELRRAMVAPCVPALNRLTAMHVESLASVFDAGLPVEIALELSAREVGVAMLVASLGIPVSAVDGATEVMHGVLRGQAEQLVVARAG
ncbi:hypothetical protein [Leucobacter chromiireducens]|uniref:hypothetical protein n=1 Tax=Leucobacter chromiireducens TaxID=283877 RepID=UPI003F7FEE47